METPIEPFAQVCEWASDRIDELVESEDGIDQLNALALISEFEEWMNIPEGHEIDYLCLEDKSWGDQEIDVK